MQGPRKSFINDLAHRTFQNKQNQQSISPPTSSSDDNDTPQIGKKNRLILSRKKTATFKDKSRIKFPPNQNQV